MQCPVDGTTLLLSERETVEIDYCPQCRGIWLDRGELDKLIRRERDDDRWDDDDDDDDRPGIGERFRDRSFRQPEKKKKRGWLSDLFEMD